RGRGVRTGEQCLPGLQPVARADHVSYRDTLGDADDEIETGVDGLVDRRGGKRRRYIDHRDRGAGRVLRVPDGRVDRNALEILAGLFRVDPRDEAAPAVGVFAAHARVELAGLAGDALGNDFRILVDWAAPLASWCRRSCG